VVLVVPLLLASPSQAATGGINVVAAIDWVSAPEAHMCPTWVQDQATDPYCFQLQQLEPERPKGDTFINVSVSRRGKPVKGGTVKLQFKFYVNRVECGLKAGPDGWVREVCEPWRSRGGTVTRTVALDSNGQGSLPIVCTDNMAARLRYGLQINSEGVANGYKIKGTYYNAKGKKVGVDSDPYVQPRADGRVCFAAWPA
jgi:hypothetical protein